MHNYNFSIDNCQSFQKICIEFVLFYFWGIISGNIMVTFLFGGPLKALFSIPEGKINSITPVYPLSHSNISLHILRSVISAQGTRHVKRRRRRADGTYTYEKSYYSDKDVEGNKRRQKRRAKRKAAAIKEAKKKYDQEEKRLG